MCTYININIMIKITASHPAYEKLSILQLELTHAINRWPFSAYQYLSEYELTLAIEQLKNEIEQEHVSILSSSVNFLN